MTLYGFWTKYGYLGRVKDRWMLFASEAEYEEYLQESPAD